MQKGYIMASVVFINAVTIPTYYHCGPKSSKRGGPECRYYYPILTMWCAVTPYYPAENAQSCSLAKENNADK